MDVQGLVDRVREAVGPATWSRGVQIARAGRVAPAPAQDDDEVRVSVSVPGRPVATVVSFWPDDEDWGCDCGRDRCIHAAAAAIAIRQGLLERGAPRRRLRYRLERTPGGLTVRPEVGDGSTFEPVAGAFHSGMGVHLTEHDLEVEEVLAIGAPLPSAGWRRMLTAWAAGNAELLLDGRRVRASAEPVGPVVVVRDAGRGFRLTLHRDARVDETFRHGVVRCGDVLHPAGDGGLDVYQRRALVRGLTFDVDEVDRLVTEVLPELRRRLTVRVRTDRLPQEVVELSPYLLVEVRELGASLEVLPRIAYGEPPVALVDAEGFHLQGRAFPVREAGAERDLRRVADARLGRPFGRRTRLEGIEAARFVRDRLQPAARRGVLRLQGELARFRVRERAAAIDLREGEGPLGLRLVSEAEPAEIVEALEGRRDLVRLRSGGWAPLPADLLDRHGDLLRDLLERAGPRGELPAHAAVEAARLARELDRPAPPSLDRLARALRGGAPRRDPRLPSNLAAVLRPYQVEGIRWLVALGDLGLGGVLADDMGLGKTLQALVATVGQGLRTLVVAPTSVVWGWRDEAERFLPGTRVCIYHGPGRRLDPAAQLVVSSYALLRQDPALLAERWDAVVLDEAQAIKNPTSRTAQAARRLQAGRRVCLTGTPVENRLDELWSQLHFLNPGLLGGRRSFEARYGRPIRQGDAEAAAALRRRIRPFLLRRLKEEVAADLPPLTTLTLRCPLPEVQQATYDAIRAAAREEVARALGAGRTLDALEQLLRLRQAACHLQLLPGERPPVSGKLDVLLEQLDTVIAEGHRALVFSQWTRFLDHVEEALRARGWTWARVDGSTRNRAEVVARFSAPDGPPIFLLSLRAAGTGLNLVAADYVFHLDPWWNPAVEQQATDRAHRIGQERPVVAVRLVAEGTVEERVLALQERKRHLADAALAEAGASPLARLAPEELLALLD